MKTAFTTLTAAALFAATSANGAAVVYESFSQTAGALNGQAASTTGLTGNWSDNQTVDVVTPTTLSYGSVANTGGQVDMTNGNGVDAWVSTSSALGNNGLLDDGATLWFSFVYSKTASGGATNEKGGFALGTDRLDGAFNGQNMTNSGNGIGVEVKATQVAAGTWSGGGNVSAGGTTAIALNTTYLIVGKIEWGATAGDDETVTIYLPSTATPGTLGAAVSTKTMGGVDQTAFDTISFTQRNSGGTVTYDEIRFGATSADVTPVPEPGSLALLGLGGLMMVKLRRRG